jgi:hypothetical protein
VRRTTGDLATAADSYRCSKLWDARGVSGGQVRRNGQRPLYEMVREHQARREAGERPAVRHCWVRPADGGAEPWPGIVVAWARGPQGWRGRVVYVVPGPEPGVGEAGVEAVNLRAAGPGGGSGVVGR